MKELCFPSIHTYDPTESNLKIQVSNHFLVMPASSEFSAIARWFQDELKKHGFLCTTQEVNSNDLHPTRIQFEESQALDSESYRIVLQDTITIIASTAKGVYYGCLTLLSLLLNQNELTYGSIDDHPDAKVRGLHLDMARKYYTKDWILSLIRSMSKRKLNTLQLHFSENEGYRLECLSHPELMSDQYITRAELKEILQCAKDHFIEIIPSFDTPGHMKHILDLHPEFRLASAGHQEPKGMDITNPEAVQFVKELLDEFVDLFSGCKQFHIGADEFFDFTNHSDYYPQLKQAAETKWGPGAHPVNLFIEYVNDIASYLEQKGLTVLAWNDGFYKNNEQNDLLVPLKSSIVITYWTNLNESMAEVKTFLEHGHSLINYNDKFFYYVLGENVGYRYPQAEHIFNNWMLGNYRYIEHSGEAQTFHAPLPDSMLGAMFSIWSDLANRQTEEEVMNGVLPPLTAMAERCWNANPSLQSFSEFARIMNTID